VRWTPLEGSLLEINAGFAFVSSALKITAKGPLSRKNKPGQASRHPEVVRDKAPRPEITEFVLDTVEGPLLL
jgi:hypothetical protein